MKHPASSAAAIRSPDNDSGESEPWPQYQIPEPRIEREGADPAEWTATYHVLGIVGRGRTAKEARRRYYQAGRELVAAAVVSGADLPTQLLSQPQPPPPPKRRGSGKGRETRRKLPAVESQPQWPDSRVAYLITEHAAWAAEGRPCLDPECGHQDYVEQIELAAICDVGPMPPVELIAEEIEQREDEERGAAARRRGRRRIPLSNADSEFSDLRPEEEEEVSDDI